jgi:MOSC domain-containing protein YiiM
MHEGPSPPGDIAGQVASINVNPRGGVPKQAIPETWIGAAGVAGDKQRNRRFHGGPRRAVSLYALERIEALQREGHPIAPGSTGENLTLAGLDWAALRPGAQLLIGAEAMVVITSYAAPCKTIAESFCDQAFTRIAQKLHPGWSRVYARVLREGQVRVGDPVVLIEAPGE